MAPSDVIRPAFLEAVDSFTDLVDRPEVERAWERPSLLPGYTVGGLVGHVLSSSSAVLRYLDGQAPAATTAPAARTAYIAGLGHATSEEFHAAIRGRGAAAAEGGQAATLEALRALRTSLSAALEAEPLQRTVTVAGGLTLRLDDYLETRIVEFVVHLDDVATSVAIDAQPPAAAAAIVIDHLLAVARAEWGERAVVRALTRRERDDVQALRVI